MTPSEFRQAVHKGQGRAFFALRRGPRPNQTDTLLQAAVGYPGFDAQMTESYGPYIAFLLTHNGQAEAAVDLVDLTVLESNLDVYHQAEVLAGLARLGTAGAREGLRAWSASRPLSSSDHVHQAFLKVWRSEGAIRLAQRCLRESFEITPDTAWWWLRLASDDFNVDKSRRFASHAKDCPELQLLLAKARVPRMPVARPPKSVSSWGDVEAAIAGGKRKEIRTALRQLETAPFKSSLENLVLTTNDRTVLWGCETHLRQKFSNLEALVARISLTQGRLRHNLCKILAGQESSLRSEIGMALLNEKDVESAFELLSASAQSTEIETMELALRAPIRGDQRKHSLALSIIRMEKRASVALLEWIYHKNPCSFCRNSAVRFLIEQKSLPKRFARECLYDADPDTRKLARKLLRTSEGIPG